MKRLIGVIASVALLSVASSHIPGVVQPRTWLPFISRQPISLSACSAGVTIPPNSFAYVDSINYLHIVGEVCNGGASVLRFIKVSADVFNATNQLVGTNVAYTTVQYVRPDTRACFHVLMTAPADWTYYIFEPVQYQDYTGALPALTVISPTGSYNASFGWYQIIGQVRNDGPQTNFVTAVATLYNGSGTVVGCDYTYVNATNLMPGQVSAFNAIFSGRDFNDVTLFSVQADGDPQ